MPLYEYYCLDCIETYEIIVPLKKHGEKIKCPKCKKELKKYINKPHLSSKRATYGY